MFTCSTTDSNFGLSALRKQGKEPSAWSEKGKGDENGFRQAQINTGAIKVQYQSICVAL